jgi:hypothetical protein
MKLVHTESRISLSKVSIQRHRCFAFGERSLGSVCEAKDKADSPVSASVVRRKGEGFSRSRFAIPADSADSVSPMSISASQAGRIVQ